jgi:hypothetical protein
MDPMAKFEAGWRHPSHPSAPARSLQTPFYHSKPAVFPFYSLMCLPEPHKHGQVSLHKGPCGRVHLCTFLSDGEYAFAVKIVFWVKKPAKSISETPNACPLPPGVARSDHNELVEDVRASCQFASTFNAWNLPSVLKLTPLLRFYVLRCS